jgi:two-component system chemotaxis response regulator CheY
MTIMNVDDSVTMRKIVTLALKSQGHTAIEAENGKHALELLPKNKVDGIILDINMPVMGGIEFLQELKKLSAYSKVPVVVLTTQGEDSLKDQALALGAKAFMVKPFQKEALLETLNKVIR